MDTNKVTLVNGTTVTLGNDGSPPAGKIVLANGGRLIMSGPVPKDVSIEFADGSGTLVVNDSQHFAASVIGFQNGDSIVFADEFATTLDYSGHVLSVYTGKETGEDPTYGTEIASFHITGQDSLTRDDLFVSRDGNGNSIINYAVQRSWVGGTGDWYSSANWVDKNGDDGYPGTGDTAVIMNGTASISAGGVNDLNNGIIKLEGSQAGLKIENGKLGDGLTLVASGLALGSADATPTLSLTGQTTLAGELRVADGQSTGDSVDLHLSVGDAGDGGAGLLTITKQGLVVAADHSQLDLDGGEVRNDGLIRVDGTLVLNAAATLDGTGAVVLKNGTLVAEGSVGDAVHIDLSGGTTAFRPDAVHDTVVIGNLATFGGVIDNFGADDVIDLASERVSDVSFDAGTGTLDLRAADGGDLGTLKLAGSYASGDFVLSSDGKAGTRITELSKDHALNHVGTTFLPTPVAAGAGATVTLQQLLTDAFGAGVSDAFGQAVVSSSSPSDLTWASYWNLAAPTVATWTTGNAAVPSDTFRTVSATDWASTVLTAGSAIESTAQVLLPTAWSGTAVAGYTAYTIETIDPRFLQQQSTPPSAAGIVAAAEALNDAYQGTPNSEDCYNIAAQVGAAAGATFSSTMWSQDPAQNVAGGFWRIAYASPSDGTAVANWGPLAQAGDTMRIGWANDGGPHSFTILDGLHDGKITVFDNGYTSADLSTADESQIGVHDVTYWKNTDPEKISIFRIDPNGQFLVLGSALQGPQPTDGEILQGNNYNDLFVPGERAVTVNLGGGTDIVADRGADLDGSKINGIANGDAIDVTDMAAAGVRTSYDAVTGVLTAVSGAQTVRVGVAKGLTGRFVSASDGGRQQLDGNTLGTIYDTLFTNGDEGTRITYQAQEIPALPATGPTASTTDPGEVTPTAPAQTSVLPPPISMPVPPSVFLVGVGGSTPGVITNGSTLTLAGSAASGAVVTVTANGVPGSVDSTTSGNQPFHAMVSPSLAQGVQQVALAITATDAAGSAQGTATTTVGVDLLPGPVGGVSIADIGSFDLRQVLDQGYTFGFVDGTQAVQLTNGTLSVGTDTNQAVVQRLYEGLLGRAADPAGLAGFTHAMANGLGAADVAGTILSSAEYAQLSGAAGSDDAGFITGAYAAFVGRAPTASELSGWTGALAGGTSRATAAATFTTAPESKAYLAGATADLWAPNPNGELVTQLYQTGLGRNPELSMVSAWSAQLDAGLSPQQLAQQVAASAEFRAIHDGQSAEAFVSSLFAAGLGRAPEPAGLQGWAGQLRAGTPPAAVLLGIAASPEAYTHLAPSV